MTALIRSSVAAAEATEAPRYGQTASGYGGKIPTPYMVRLADDPATGRMRRVYAAVYGNSGSLYVVRGGECVWLDGAEVEVALGR